jgi:hypothetical protein
MDTPADPVLSISAVNLEVSVAYAPPRPQIQTNQLLD